MLQGFLSRINWVDIVCVILIIRITYVGVKSGLSAEIFKFLGVLSAAVLASAKHIYIGGLIGKFISQSFLRVICFSAIVIATMFAFYILRMFLGIFLKLQPVNWLEKAGGFILGLARSIVFVSLVLTILMMVPNNSLKSSIKDKSFSGNYFLQVTPKIYSFAARIFPNLSSESEVPKE